MFTRNQTKSANYYNPKFCLEQMRCNVWPCFNSSASALLVDIKTGEKAARGEERRCFLHLNQCISMGERKGEEGNFWKIFSVALYQRCYYYSDFSLGCALGIKLILGQWMRVCLTHLLFSNSLLLFRLTIIIFKILFPLEGDIVVV